MRLPSSCSRSSGGVSMRITAPPSVSTAAPTRVRLSRGSSEWQTAQPHPSCGTPKLVPVPRKVSFTAGVPPPGTTSYRLDLEEIRRAGHVEWHAGRHDDAIPLTRQAERPDGVEGQLHHVRVRLAVRDETGDDTPDEGELPVGAFLVGEDQDRHARPMRRDDAGGKSALREHDETRGAEAAHRRRG